MPPVTAAYIMPQSGCLTRSIMFTLWIILTTLPTLFRKFQGETMRLIKLLVTVIICLVMFNASAAEKFMEPHAMLYYQVTFGNNHAHAVKQTFGLRLDEALVEPRKPIDYQKLFRRPAVINLKMNDAGVMALNITGVNFLKQIRTLHASEDDANTAAGGSGAEAKGQAQTAKKKGGFFKLPDYSNAIKKSQYLGLGIGILVGIGFAMGVGG